MPRRSQPRTCRPRVPEQDGGALEALLGYEAQDVSRLLDSPIAGWVDRCFADDDATRTHVDEEEDVSCPPTAPGPDGLGEEVAGPEGLRVRLEELIPGRLVPRGRGLDPVLPQDGPDRGARDVRKPELPEFAHDAAVSPRGVVGGQSNDEPPHFLGLSGSARLAGGGDSLCRFSCPSPKRVVADNRDQESQHRTQPRGQTDELVPLPSSQALVAGDPVLGAEELDLTGQVSVRGIDQGERAVRSGAVWPQVSPAAQARGSRQSY